MHADGPHSKAGSIVSSPEIGSIVSSPEIGSTVSSIWASRTCG
ncbi:hypothetical protein [Natrarchaeobius halalkaliphilus]|nr:hypothetical protein [Natrarchaeobius halalkaliphilus]